MKNKILVALFALAMISTAGIASAASPVTTQFKVKLNLEQGCLFNGASDLDFGTHSVLTEAINESAPASISVACSKDLSYKISFNDGVNGGYKMSNGTDIIDYTLYTDAGRQAPITAASVIDAVGTGENETFQIYGQVVAGQGSVSPGQYEDTITVTASY